LKLKRNPEAEGGTPSPSVSQSSFGSSFEEFVSESGSFASSG